MNRKHRLGLTTVVVMTAASALTAAATAHAAPEPAAASAAPLTVRSAVVAVTPNFPDPGFSRFELTTAQTPRFYLYATGVGFPVSSSSTAIGGYSPTTSSMQRMPKWARDKAPELWAPHVTSKPNGDLPGQFTYVMYFNARHSGEGKGQSAFKDKHCIGTAESSSPSGPFVPRKRALLCPPAGYDEVLDPAVYTEGGVKYLIYKLGDNAGTPRFSIKARPLNGSGMKVKGSALTLLSEAQTGGVNAEAPDILRAGQRTHLFVSRNFYKTEDYATQSWSAGSIRGLASSRGRWVEGLGLDEAEGLVGPGGAEVIRDGDELRVAFHSHHNNPPNPEDDGRLAYTGTLDRDGDAFSLR